MIRKKTTRILAVSSLVLFVLIAFGKNTPFFETVNTYVSEFIHTLQTPSGILFGILVEYLFGTIELTLVILVICAYFLIYHPSLRRDTYILAGAMMASALSVFVLKHLINQPRPLEALIQLSDPAFPSGHTTSAVVFFGLLLCIVWKRYTFFHWILAVSAILFVGLIAFFRLYLGVHTVSDVLGGLFLGLFFISLTLSLIDLD